MSWFSKNNPATPRSRMEMVQDYLSRAKPFTKALMLRASQHGDDAYEDLKKMVGRVNYQEDDHTFDDFVGSGAVSTSLEISRLAAKSIGKKDVYLPGFDVPPEAPFVVGFSACVLDLMNKYLIADEVKIDFHNAIIDVCKLHYMFHENLEASERSLEGLRVYERIRDDRSSPGINSWRDAMSELVYMYVMQWTSENEQFKNYNYSKNFGKALQMLIG